MNFLTLIKDMPSSFEVHFEDAYLFQVRVLCWLDEGFNDVVVAPWYVPTADGNVNILVIEGELVLL